MVCGGLFGEIHCTNPRSHRLHYRQPNFCYFRIGLHSLLVFNQCNFLHGFWSMVWNQINLRLSINRQSYNQLNFHTYLHRNRRNSQSICDCECYRSNNFQLYSLQRRKQISHSRKFSNQYRNRHSFFRNYSINRIYSLRSSHRSRSIVLTNRLLSQLFDYAHNLR